MCGLFGIADEMASHANTSLFTNDRYAVLNLVIIISINTLYVFDLLKEATHYSHSFKNLTILTMFVLVSLKGIFSKDLSSYESFAHLRLIQVIMF